MYTFIFLTVFSPKKSTEIKKGDEAGDKDEKSTLIGLQFISKREKLENVTSSPKSDEESHSTAAVCCVQYPWSRKPVD